MITNKKESRESAIFAKLAKPEAVAGFRSLHEPVPPLALLEPELFGERLSVHEVTCALRLEIGVGGTFRLRDWAEQIERHFPACFSRTANTRVLLAEMALVHVVSSLPVDVSLALPDFTTSHLLILPACTADGGSGGEQLIYRSPLLSNERIRWFGLLPSSLSLFPSSIETHINHNDTDGNDDDDDDDVLLQTTQPAYWYAYREMSHWLASKLNEGMWRDEKKMSNSVSHAPLVDIDAIPVYPRNVHPDWCPMAPIYRVPRVDLETVHAKMRRHLAPHIGHSMLQDLAWEVRMDAWDLERLADAMVGVEGIETVHFTLRIQCVLMRLGDVYERMVS